ncbi:MAG: hypothetical protein ACTIOG_15500, partial [Pseudomonas helleri]
QHRTGKVRCCTQFLPPPSVIWRAFDNQYWPAHYFVDAKGQVRATHFGEGMYQQQEQFIQRLLAESHEQ